MKDQLPPHSYEAECGLLGCMLQAWNEVGPEIGDLPEEAFYDARNRHVYKIIHWLNSRGKMVDASAVYLASKKSKNDFGGIAYLSTLENATPSPANFPTFLEEVSEKSLRRKVIQICGQLSEQAINGITTDELLSNIQNLTALEKSGSVPIVDSKMAMDRMLVDLQRRSDLCGALSGIDTGFPDLNSLTDGLQCGEQFVIAARPGLGKSSMGGNIFHHVGIVQKIPSLFVSIEMPVESLCRRFLSFNQDIDMGTLRRGTYDKEVSAKIAKFYTIGTNSPLYFIDAFGGININELSRQIKRAVRKHGIKLVVIDYLQKIDGDRNEERKTYEIGTVSKKLHALAVETKAAFLTLAQLNRESDKDKGRPPKLSDLGDSKQIEQDAETVGLIYQPDLEKPEVKLVIPKQRDGARGTVNLLFDGKHCRFENPQ